MILVIAKQNWQLVIDARSSAVKTDFMRKWCHDRFRKHISLNEVKEGEVFDATSSRGEFEQNALSQILINTFAESCISERDREILRLRMEGCTEQESAVRVSYQSASAVHKRISRIASAYEDFVTSENQQYLGQ